MSDIPLALFNFSANTLNSLLSTWGYPIVGLFVGIESTGIPFPGETMLLAAAVYAGTGHLQIEWVIVAAAFGAIMGDNLGFLAGHFGGRPLVERYGRYIRIKPEHLDRATEFFRRYGDRTVFFGRFVAVLRAWAAFLAGVNRMPWHKFFVFNAAGGILWATIYGLLGYALGNNLPLLHRITAILGIGGVAVAALVVIVALAFYWRRRRAGHARAGETAA